MTNATKKLFIPATVALLLIGWVAFLIIDYRLVENPARKRQAVQVVLAAGEAFPDLKFGWSPARGFVIIRAFGAKDARKVQEIKDWLVVFKKQNNLDASITLEVYDSDDSEMLAKYDDL